MIKFEKYLKNKSICNKNFTNNIKNKNRSIKKETIKKSEKTEEIKNKKSSILEDKILIYQNLNSRKYYLLNLPFLGIYSIISIKTILNKEYPDYLKKQMLIFSGIAINGIIILFLISNRQIKRITLLPQSKELIIEANTYFTLNNSMKYIMKINEIKHIESLSRYIYTKKTGLYLIKPEKKYFNLL